MSRKFLTLILIAVVLVITVGCSHNLDKDGNYNGLCRLYDCRVQYGTLDLTYGHNLLFSYENMEYTYLCAIPGCNHGIGTNCPAAEKTGKEFVRYGKHYWFCRDDKVVDEKIVYYLKLMSSDVTGENEHTVCTVKNYTIQSMDIGDFVTECDRIYFIALLKTEETTENRLCSIELTSGRFKEICSFGEGDFSYSLLGLFDNKLFLSNGTYFDMRSNSFGKNDNISRTGYYIIRDGYYGYYDDADFVVLKEDGKEIRVPDVASMDIFRDNRITLFDDRLFVSVDSEKPYYVRLNSEDNRKNYYDSGIDTSGYYYVYVHDEYKDNLILVGYTSVEDIPPQDGVYYSVDYVPTYYKIPKSQIYGEEVS